SPAELCATSVLAATALPPPSQSPPPQKNLRPPPPPPTVAPSPVARSNFHRRCQRSYCSFQTRLDSLIGATKRSCVNSYQCSPPGRASARMRPIPPRTSTAALGIAHSSRPVLSGPR